MRGLWANASALPAMLSVPQLVGSTGLGSFIPCRADQTLHARLVSVQGISYAICYDTTGEPSGKEVRDAEQKGGADAQAAAFAMLRDAERACGTSNPGAAGRTYHAAIAPLIEDPADVEAAKQ